MYVFCGSSSNGSFLNSIESLKLEVEASEQKQQIWQLIPEKQTKRLTPRIDPVSCPLNANQILIMGGKEGYSSYNDSFVFDVKRQRVLKGSELEGLNF